MLDYQLEIKQIVDYPRCRIYRQFVQSLLNDQSLRTNGSSGLFYFTVLCSYANFRTSYRRIDGVTYTVYPGEWLCTLKELSQWFRTRFHHQALNIMEELQKRHLISYLPLAHGKVIKYKIRGWKKHNTVLDYNCPCQKNTGFFFMPIATATELVGSGRCSEMDALLDLWLCTIYNDEQVQGSEAGPVVYLRNGTGSPLVSYSELSSRWGVSKATVGRYLKKLTRMEYISLATFPGTTGSVIYLQNYLSTMFQISDVLLDKEELAMTLNIRISLPDKEEDAAEPSPQTHDISVSEELSSVSKTYIRLIIEKLENILDSQGISCFKCSKIQYKLFPLSDACREEYLIRARETAGERFGLRILCGDRPVYTFELMLKPISNNDLRRK